MTLEARTADTMKTMRKPWVYKRKNVKGWWTGWYEGGKRKAKAFPSKTLAEHFRHIKYTQLNSDVFTSTVPTAGESSPHRRLTLSDSVVEGVVGSDDRSSTGRQSKPFASVRSTWTGTRSRLGIARQGRQCQNDRCRRRS
jgi:hypothetical protein